MYEFDKFVHTTNDVYVGKGYECVCEFSLNVMVVTQKMNETRMSLFLT